MAHGQGATGRRQNKGKRAHGTDPNKKKSVRRKSDDRVQAAAEATRQAQAELDALIEKQSKHPVVGEAAGARYARDLAAKQKAVDAAAQAEADAACEKIEIRNPSWKMRPCPDSKKCKPHVEHSWEQGGLQVKRWCLGYAERKDESTPLKSAPPVKRMRYSDLPREGDGKWEFAYTTARLMLKQGYNIKYVIEFTGIGLSELEDMDMDTEGYGVRPAEEEDKDGTS